MFQKAWEIIKNNKKKVIATGIGASAMLTYLYMKNERSKILEDQEVKNYYSTCMRDLYENNKNIADTALRTVLPDTLKKLSELKNLESLFTQLKANKDSLTKEEKEAIWEEIKLSSFSRNITATYSISLIHMLFSLQVFIIGRYLFINHVEQHSNNDKKQSEVLNLSVKTQQNFLSYSEHFKNNGIEILTKIVEECVQDVMKNLSLKKLFSSKENIDLFNVIRSKVEEKLFETDKDGLCKISEILLENEENDKTIDKQLLSLLNELRDILDGNEFKKVFKKVSNSGFSVLYSNMDKVMLNDKLHLANLAMRLTRETRKICDSRISNEYLTSIQSCEEFNKFCLVVYSMCIEF